MVNSVSSQTLEFFYSALLGICLGVLFDFIRVIRFYIPKNKFITALADVFFWVTATILLLAFVLTVSGGEMRWYVLVGAFCGGFVYVSAISEIMFRVLVLTVFVLRKLLSLITRPVYLLLRWMWRSLKSFGRAAQTRGRCVVKAKQRERREKIARKKEKEKTKPSS